VLKDPMNLTWNIFCCDKKDKPKKSKAGYLELKFGEPILKSKEITMEEKTITNEQKVPATIAPKTLSGKVAKVDGVPVWTITSTSGGGTLEVASDGMSAFIVSGDAPDEINFTAEADADLGQGVVSIIASGRVIVEGAMAVNLGLGFGEAVPK